MKKFGKSDSEHKLLKDRGNLMMSLKCFSAYEWYYNSEADIEKNLLLMIMVMRRREKWKLGYREEFAFDDYGDEEEGEVEAGVTEAGKGPGIVFGIVCTAMSKKKTTSCF